MSLWIIISIVLFILLSGIVAMLYVTMPIAKNVYEQQLVKTSDEKWNRVCSAPENEEQLQMWNDGVKWGEENRAFMQEVSVSSDGLKLYGEYYNFGSDKCAIILPGRCECLIYSYYFAKPYKEAGLNVLVIDSRCHGKSDGKYSTIGVKESEDVVVWKEYMKKEHGVKSFWIHGICIGSGAGLYAASSPDCTDVSGIVLEGCFVSFRESFKRHMIDINKPTFPVLDLVMFNIRRFAKVNPYAKTPLKAVKKIHQPILFLFGKQDKFSIPPKSQKLFEACASKNKKIVWFDKGGHSHLRINNTEKYDNAIKEFVNEHENEKSGKSLLHN
ncbi:MAG: dienelactone hydrolase family protein [Clostridia bacterium]|nr:dienelactone hydrolase family protein [Clostridia bacterium]